MKKPEKRSLKTILKDKDMWNTARLWMAGIALALISRIFYYFRDYTDGNYVYLFVGLLFLGGILVAGPFRKEWDKGYKKKK